MADGARTDWWLHWPDKWDPTPEDKPCVVLGRPAGDGACQQVWLREEMGPRAYLRSFSDQELDDELERRAKAERVSRG